MIARIIFYYYLMRRSTFLIVLCVALLLGLLAAKFTYPATNQWLVSLIFLLPLLFISKTRIPVLIFMFFVLGWWRGGMLQTEYQYIAQSFNQKVTVVGLALEDGYYSYNGQLETSVILKSINGKNTIGTITVRGYTSSIMRYDTLEITGKIRPTKGGKQAVISYAEINKISSAESRVEVFRRSFIASMQSILPEPASGLGVGILVGQRNLLPNDVESSLQVAGLTHIIAVSGYNLTIIINAVRRSSKRLSRFQVVAVSATLIYLFLLITGFSPSIVRASMVAGIGLLAWYYGRTVRPLLLILLTAALTGFYNPFYVWGDIGWYLSFLAFSGVLIIAPLIIKLFARKELPLLPTVAIESFSAQLMTLPLIMYVFGKISLVGFFANVIIVPLVPVAMLASSIAGLSGIISPIIGGWVAIPARVLLNSMVRVAEWFADWPHASSAVYLSFSSMILLYVLIGIVVIGLKKRSQSVIIKESN